jgi:plastocyanin
LRNGRTITVGVALIFVSVLGAQAQQPLTGRVELTRNGHRLKNESEAVVWLTPVGTKVDPPHQNPSEVPKLVQKDKSFRPDLLVIPVGGKVEFPNSDPFFHNVFSLFEGKRFDLGLYESGTTRFVQFDKPGISFIFCNIHAQMSAVIITLTTPYYGVSDPRGQLTINDVPPGRYELQIFHAAVPPDALRALTREVTIAPGQNTLGN